MIQTTKGDGRVTFVESMSEWRDVWSFEVNLSMRETSDWEEDMMVWVRE